MGEYDDAVKRNPQNAKAYYERSMKKRDDPRLWDYEGALADLNQAIYLDPKMAAAYEARGKLKARLNGVQDALADLNQAIYLNPKMPSIYRTRAVVKAAVSAQDALADLNQAISLNARYPTSDREFDPAMAYYSRGSLKVRLGDAKGAVADYDKYISLNPESAYAYKLLAALKADKLKDFQGALADYKKALSLSKNDSILDDIISPTYPTDLYIQGSYGEPESYENRAKLKTEKVRNPQAVLAYYNELIKLSEKSEDVLYEYLYVRRADLKAYQLNDLRGALADYNRAIEIDPEALLPFKARVEFKADKLNDRRGALAEYTQRIKSYVNESHAYHDLAEFKANQLRDYQGALADYNKSISLYTYPEISNHYLPETYLTRGVLKYTKLSDRAGGIADIKKALQLVKEGKNTEFSNMALRQLKSWGVSN
jgi:tetratricopeptide (TPR) repeat protein